MKRACRQWSKRGVYFIGFLFLFFLQTDVLASAEIREIIFPEAKGIFSVDKEEEEVYSNQVKLKKSTAQPKDDAVISFYKYDSQSSQFLTLSHTTYSDDATLNGNFKPVFKLTIDGKEIDISQKLPAVKCLVYKKEEPLIVLYHDSRLKEKKSVCIMIESDKDHELLKIEKLRGSEATFVGYITTSTTSKEVCDGKLFVEKGTEIRASLYHEQSKNRSMQYKPTLFAVAGVEIAPLEVKSQKKEQALWISSTVSKKEAMAGEYLEYRIYVNNSGQQDIDTLTMVHQLSSGISYQKGSFFINGKHIDDNRLSMSKNIVGNQIASLKSGEEIEVSFTAYIGMKAEREVFNETFVSYNQNTLTYNTKAITKIKKERHSSNTIVGKITSEDNITLAGVRLYLENGDFVFSDINGKYHFDNLSSSLHVVSLDKSSLSSNLEPTLCSTEESYVGSATSQFVDLTYTNIKKTRFCLKKSAKPQKKEETFHYKIEKKVVQKMPVYTSLDIQKHSQKQMILWPKEGYLPSMPSLKVAVLHGEKEKLKLFLNNKEVDMLAYDGFVKGKKKQKRISRYTGLDLQKGDNILVAKLYTKENTLIRELKRVVHLSTAPVRAEVVEEKSYLKADGEHSAVIAVRFYDASGYPLRSGMVGSYTVEKPYISQERIDELAKNPLAMISQENRYTISHDGIAYIKLKATSKSGEVKLHFPFQNDDEYTKAWLESSAREWFIVGFAEGSASYNSIKQHLVATKEEKLTHDGRVALFAKGKIKADLLLTLAYDSGKEADLGLVDEINPESFYTVYADASLQNSEAPSAKKLYVKLEKEKFYAMFGDFDTGIDNTTLSKYTRRINGLKSEYKGKRFEYTAFATKSAQRFVKDEIRGDGTSGLYHLSNEDIMFASEKVMIEVRDRFRDEVIVSRKNLTALIDYSIDYSAGTLYFKYPISSRDEAGNPQYIVVDYEVGSGEKEVFSYGGRAAVKFLNNRVEVATTYLHIDSGIEDDSLVGFDSTIKFNHKTTLKAEYAQSHHTKETNSTTADAYLLELTHHDKHLDARAYIKEQSDAFGLGQQNRSENATRKYGLEGTYSYWKHVALKFALYSEEELIGHLKRDVADIKVAYDNRLLLAHAGYRVIREDSQTNTQLLAGVSKRFLNQKLKLGISSEYAINQPTQSFPNRLLLESAYTINKYAEVFANYEILDYHDKKSQLSHIGLKGRPWQGAVIDNAISSEIDGENLRLFNHLGIQQNIKLSKALMLSASVDKEQTIDGEKEGDFTSYSISATYTKPTWGANAKSEYKEAKEKSINVDVGLYTKMDQRLGLAFGIRANKIFDAALDSSFIGAKFSLAYRPESGMAILNRLDMTQREDESYKIRKLINHSLFTTQLYDYLELSTSYGIKYIEDTIGNQMRSSVSDTVGVESIYTLSSRFSLGVHAHMLHDYTSKELSYATGSSIGYRLFKNGLLMVGYNFNGYKDQDFSRFNETEKGLYIKMRMKFDQDSLKEGLNYF
jgi:uncharacterized repeat protein (TIGR01451 family)